MKMDKITMRKAIDAKCWDCVGAYADGKVDCENTQCPLYAYMPYAKRSVNPWWMEYRTRARGLQLRADCKIKGNIKSLENARKRRQTIKSEEK